MDGRGLFFLLFLIQLHCRDDAAERGSRRVSRRSAYSFVEKLVFPGYFSGIRGRSIANHSCR
jgi:hypothetical protein